LLGRRRGLARLSPGYSDYWTQGETLDDLKEHLKDLYQDISGGQIPGIRKVEDLVAP
jgi:hypothetical protein